MKEQDKSSGEQLSDVETGSLSVKDFIEMIMKITQYFKKRMGVVCEKLEEIFKEELENIKLENVNNKQSWRIQWFKWKIHCC